MRQFGPAITTAALLVGGACSSGEGAGGSREAADQPQLGPEACATVYDLGRIIVQEDLSGVDLSIEFQYLSDDVAEHTDDLVAEGGADPELVGKLLIFSRDLLDAADEDNVSEAESDDIFDETLGIIDHYCDTIGEERSTPTTTTIPPSTVPMQSDDPGAFAQRPSSILF